MKIFKATQNDLDTIYKIVHKTINNVYPLYYPTDVVQFFLDYHSIESIKKALDSEYILLLELDGNIIGTGSILNNEIKRMFILPEFQGKGYGSLLLKELEQEAANEGYDTVILDASLPGYSLYEKSGYTCIKYNKIVTSSKQVLCYNQMSKSLTNLGSVNNYTNHLLSTIPNSNTDDVSNKTLPKYKEHLNVKRINRIVSMLFEEIRSLSDEGRDLPIRWNVMHMYSSSQLAKLLALRKGLNMELASIAAAIHDIAVIVTKKTEGHAEKAEKYVRDFIEKYNKSILEKNIQIITDEEEALLINAIIKHSDKKTYSDDPFVELLKDVDSLDRYLHGIKSEGAYLERCTKVFNEFGIETPTI